MEDFLWLGLRDVRVFSRTSEKVAEQRSESFLNELEGWNIIFTDEEFARLKRRVKRRGSAAASATAVPIEEAPARPTSMGMFMPSTILELRDRRNLGMFLKRFRTWACLNRCDYAYRDKISDWGLP